MAAEDASGLTDIERTVPEDAAAAELDAVMKQLHRTENAFAPAIKAEKDRRHTQAIAGASVKLNFILVGAVFLSILGNIFLGWYATHPVREYFASDNGRIFPLIPMSQPYRKTADVIQYAKETMNSSFTMDFLNWRSQLEDTRQRYTRDGFKSFLNSLKGSGVLDTVRERRMNMSISAGTGVLTKEGIEDGHYVWIIELPIEVRLSGQTSEMPAQHFLATIRVDRVSTLDSIEGIGVAQLITKPL